MMDMASHSSFPHLKTFSWSSQAAIDMLFLQGAPILQTVIMKALDMPVVNPRTLPSVENLELDFGESYTIDPATFTLLAIVPNLRQLKLYNRATLFARGRCNVDPILRLLTNDQEQPHLWSRLSRLIVEHVRISQKEVCGLSRSRDPTAREVGPDCAAQQLPSQLLITLHSCSLPDVEEADYMGLTQALGVNPTVPEGRDDRFDSEAAQNSDHDSESWQDYMEYNNYDMY
jgi:hypothetical protein